MTNSRPIESGAHSSSHPNKLCITKFSDPRIRSQRITLLVTSGNGLQRKHSGPVATFILISTIILYNGIQFAKLQTVVLRIDAFDRISW